MTQYLVLQVEKGDWGGGDAGDDWSYYCFPQHQQWQLNVFMLRWVALRC